MSNVPAARTMADPGLLGIYLNDHLAGATGGLELARRVARAQRARAGGPAMERLLEEISEDRAALLQIMAALEIPVRRYKAYAAWAAEKVGRLKFNGRVVARSPLSRLVELEILRLGVEAKAAGWMTLRELAEGDDRLEVERLDDLVWRARRQSETLEELRMSAVAEAFGVWELR
jgi:hypothetical protein